MLSKLHNNRAIITTFLYGVLGNVGVEVLTMLYYFQNDQPLPLHYSEWSYYCLRGVIGLIAGFLTVAYGVRGKPLLAINIGASTPLILHALARGLR